MQRVVSTHRDVGAQRQSVFDVRDYGATGDGTTDDTAAIQAAITACGAGGSLVFPRPSAYYKITSTLTPLVGQTFSSETGLQYPYSSAVETKIQATHDGTMIDITSASGFAIRGLTLQGTNNAAHTNSIGITGTSSFACEIDHCAFLFFGGPAIKWISGNALRLTNSFTSNCVLSYASLSAWLGAVDLDATDHYVHHNEFGANNNFGAGFAACLVLRSGGSFISDNVAELAEVGFVVTTAALQNRLIDNRADHMLTHGFVIEGSNHILIGNCSAQNGLQTTNTYDGFRIASTGHGNLLIGNIVQNIGGGNVPKYAYNVMALDSAGAGNVLKNNLAPTTSYATSRYNITNAYTVVEDSFENAAVTVGDGDVSWIPHISPRTQIFTVPLTANRSFGLGIPNSTNGLRCRIVRAATATGAFTLTITQSGGGTLATLAINEWVELEMTESTNKWMVIGKGSL